MASLPLFLSFVSVFQVVKVWDKQEDTDGHHPQSNPVVTTTPPSLMHSSHGPRTYLPMYLTSLHHTVLGALLHERLLVTIIIMII